MRRTGSALGALLVWFLASVIGMLGVGFVVSVLGVPSLADPTGIWSAGCIFLGLAWLVLGFLLAPSVETFMSPGTGGRAPPILWPGSARPEPNQEVIEDLGEKLSSGTDLGIATAALGAVLFLVGVIFYLAPVMGLVALVIVCAGVVGMRTIPPHGRGSARTPSKDRVPPNP